MFGLRLLDGHRLSILDAIPCGTRPALAQPDARLGSGDHLFADRWHIHPLHLALQSSRLDNSVNASRLGGRSLGVLSESDRPLQSGSLVNDYLPVARLATSDTAVCTHSGCLRKLDGTGGAELHAGDRVSHSQPPYLVYPLAVAFRSDCRFGLPRLRHLPAIAINSLDIPAFVG